MSKTNVTVSHSGISSHKIISVEGVAWGYATKKGSSWEIFQKFGGARVATADSFRGIEFAVLALF